MRILLFTLMILICSCGGESANQKNSPAVQAATTTIKDKNAPKSYKKTVTNSEFAVFKTTSATEDLMEYYFKTLDGISIKFTIPHEGEPKIKVPENLLENAKYQEGFPGANPEMAGKVFEIIYDKDNIIAEVKLAIEE